MAVSRIRRWRPTTPVITAVLLAAMPLIFISDFARAIQLRFCVMLLLLTGLNFINGYARMSSLAQAGFYGLGAYTAGILAARLDVPPALAFVAAPVLATVAALVIGAASLRLRATYFTMATLGAGYILYILFGRMTGVTGGPNGLLGIPALSVAGIEISGPLPMYVLAAALALLGVVVAYNFERSRAGRALRALGASEPAAVASGVRAFRLRLFAFALSGCYAGVAGALETFDATFVSPSSFGFLTAVLCVVGLTVGGAGRAAGPLIGAALLTALDELGTEYAGYEMLIVGLVFLVVVQAFPGGVAGAVGARWPRRGARPAVARATEGSAS
ncbi:branched-chain amino acid ABC transporter permease [Microtetraspora sp. AC03309]|uniref:branched-chain amino acid ABC transporter permease n=1 Tax=Microtetraspora sp. AC03309 TaxID=2779376 RepID=UPI001E571B3F|nr:branched-chain amino acid ABC transporter permease [Microtetraspora sp. AC03309]MCC5579546.1 branched-chain amino acid ABC transporter permease [Microtetraspora sp. AC03309]